MSLKSKIVNLFEKRAVSNSPNDPLWGNFSLWGSKSGIDVTPDKALHVSAVFACIRVLSESIASLPIKFYERTDEGKKELSDNALYTLLRDGPNEFNTSYEFRETMMAHLNLRGNFYAVKEYNGAGKLGSLTILNPANMQPEFINDELIYKYMLDGKEQIFTKDEIWHVRGLSTDGIMGLSPISVARESIGLAMATEAHGSRLFKNGAQIGGVLQYPGKLSESAHERLVNNWQKDHTGSNTWKTALLEEGLDFKAVGFSNDDAQFLETRTFQVEDIARIFRVPSVLIGRPDTTSTYASAEQFFLSFVVHTIRPWVVRIEQSINKHLIPEKDRGKYFAEFQLDGLMRGDIKSRYDAYAIAIQNKWMNANEVRKKENMNSRGPDGDVYENPNITVNAEQMQEVDDPEPSA